MTDPRQTVHVDSPDVNSNATSSPTAYVTIGSMLGSAQSKMRSSPSSVT